MDRADVDRWMRGYLRAWQTNDPEEIATLFTEDARYYTAPFREPWSGRDTIVEGWLDRKDEEGQWSFRWELVGTEGDLAFVRGWTDYPHEGQSYHNLWVIRLEQNGLCSEFTEWWMEVKR